VAVVQVLAKTEAVIRMTVGYQRTQGFGRLGAAHPRQIAFGHTSITCGFRVPSNIIIINVSD